MITRKIFSPVFLCMFLGACAVSAQTYSVNNVHIYQTFPNHGTTAGIVQAFLHPETHAVDTNANTQFSITPAQLEAALAAAKVKKHFQQKLAGITYAGTFTENGKQHFFAYFATVKLLIDFTDKKNYYLQQALPPSKVE